MHYRSIFMSDFHLGTRGCQADKIAKFLNTNTCDTLYLIGDIIDFWLLKKSIYFPESHANVIRKILKMVHKGTKVYYIPGNHDECIRNFCPMIFGGIEICNEIIHENTDGKKFLVIHGDQFDQVVKYAKFLAVFGAIGYEILLKINRFIHFFRNRLGLKYWSLSKFVKDSVKQASNFIGGFEAALAAEVKSRKLDGIIAGHIHHCVIKTIDGILYLNTGDGVESCTAIVEHDSCLFEIVHYGDQI